MGIRHQKVTKNKVTFYVDMIKLMDKLLYLHNCTLLRDENGYIITNTKETYRIIRDTLKAYNKVENLEKSR